MGGRRGGGSGGGGGGKKYWGEEGMYKHFPDINMEVRVDLGE